MRDFPSANVRGVGWIAVRNNASMRCGRFRSFSTSDSDASLKREEGARRKVDKYAKNDLRSGYVVSGLRIIHSAGCRHGNPQQVDGRRIKMVNCERSVAII